MPEMNEEILITREQIARRVEEMAKEISADQEGRHLVVICILKGSFIFMADLVRKLTCPLSCEFVQVRMVDAPENRQFREIDYIMEFEVDGKDILIVEDIFDSGITIDYLLEHFRDKNPRSMRVCVLLDKSEAHKVEVPVDYVGFSIPRKFVVGYGLDYGERYRELSHIAVLDGVKWPLSE